MHPPSESRLFDVRGNSSIGMLPQAKLVVKERNFPILQIPKQDVQPGFLVGTATANNGFLGQNLHNNQ